MSERVAFIGGGNMASAIISGLIEQGFPASQLDVVEPFAAAQEKLKGHFGVDAHERPGAFLSDAKMVIWAVKPQVFKEAALQVRFHTKGCLHLSVAAGIRSDSMARWLDTDRVVRAMPNTPALIGKGITALFARSEVSNSDKNKVEQVIANTGDFLWVTNEDQLDEIGRASCRERV